MSTEEERATERTITAAFGAENRARLLEEYFATQTDATPASAWRHVYSLLLWIDRTTGLGHCYESDKCQPGKPWYGRSLAFHSWAATALDATPTNLADKIDWLFRRATADLAIEVLRRANSLAVAGEKQRKRYEGQGFPQPGEDPQLVSIVREALGGHLTGEPSPKQWQLLVERIREYLMLENKRRNLVGEGFEDVLAAVIRRAVGPEADVRVRRPLYELPGFIPHRKDEKPNKVDLAILGPAKGRRTLVTAKWSLRADREKQFVQEFADYVKADEERAPFDYVFVTNEFDPARLMRACQAYASNAFMFRFVVHINPDALKATYALSEKKAIAKTTDGDPAAPKPKEEKETMRKVMDFIESGRLISLKNWLDHLKK